MTSRTPLRAGTFAAVLVAGLGTLTACTASATSLAPTTPVPAYRLVAFDSCAEALDEIRAAAKASVGPYGLNQVYGDMRGSAAVPAPAAGAVPQAMQGNAATKDAAPGETPAYSGTNTQEAGVDEPDLVKTDGHRIVVVHNGVLRIVDAATQTVTGTVDLVDPSVSDDVVRYEPAELLLSGDHALVLLTGGGYPGGVAVPVPAQPMPAQPPVANGGGETGSGASVGSDAAGSAADGSAIVAPGVSDPGKPAAGPVSGPTGTATPISGPRLILVDLASGRVLSRLSVDGMLLDARQSGSIARVVVSSAPRISFPDVTNANDAQRIKVNQQILDQATLDRWLPRIDVSTGSSTTHPQVGCDAVSRPSVYSGDNMLTVLSLDLGASTLADPAPVSVLADGQTVYSNGASLYVATDQRWRVEPLNGVAQKGMAQQGPATVDPGTTTVYKFDTSNPGRPSFVAGGSVPGYLINQYAMSDRGGYLRVATTSGNANWESNSAVTSQSGVYVLHADGGSLRQVGKVEGLGRGEKIYAVRFLDTTAYVVTFKQTDPLYTVDLTDPTKPTVHGALKISGYSSYLHPTGDGRLIGIGQDVNQHVQAIGTQISLFDVSNLDSPSRLAVYTLPGQNSQAEFDPHAFLYWRASGLLVIPLNSGMVDDVVEGPGGQSSSGIGALVLHIGGNAITKLGFVSQPVTSVDRYAYPIQRSLVIGSTLWTVSDNGLMASDLTTLQRTAWIALT